ncbi:acetyl-CoA acetyltransferase [Flavonifractor plautii]|uniref:Acetyl-CoA acetyltransferase n=1 Tax=Flavonifractor plautii TaxID=292800 RepID=A0AAX1KGZ5_FLAPL|nr:thiolase family protein [Flavonifractor plautii]ANU42038.1 acetyl-CoA acetyltransferase [Flavonifractor plautii]OXE48711.1 acetyl-CoA acetyltransferase [Flavonifractor plautii]QQR05084.1 thiolase family protein [Flavonifractor plautii]UQA25889.1 thiolase family protein [Flavonifractor plautii]
MKREAVIVSVVRTPVGRCRGALAAVGAPELGALVIAEAVRRAGLQGEEVEEVIFGNLGNNDSANLARVVTLQAGLPFTVPAITIDRQCSSGLNAIAIGALMIEAGEADILVAGGTESDSNRPHLMEKARVAYQVAPPQWLVRRTAPGALNVSMGTTAENLGRKYHITREECDAFALESHRKAAAAQAAGRFDEQMIPVTVPGKRGKTTVVDRDECVRPESTMETLGSLPTAFEPDGVCTAGNSSPMSDGAGAVVLMDRETAEKKGLEPLAVFRGFAVTGCDPSIMGIGPVEAIRKVLRKTGLTLEEMDLIELNEAFATQSIACIRELGLDMDKVNVNGGALALGHPLAGTGAILTAKLLYELKRRRARYGLVAFCMAGGQGGAAVFERI